MDKLLDGGGDNADRLLSAALAVSGNVSGMRVVCAWCRAAIRAGCLPVSHGICPTCSDEMLASVK